MARYRKPYTLFKRGKVYYYRTYDATGYRTAGKSTGCTNKIDAIKYCENLYLKGSLNQVRITFKDYASNFYDENSIFVKDRSRGISWNTVYHYQQILKARLLPYFGNMLLSDITYSILKEYRIKLKDECSDSYINLIFTTLGNILKFAFLDDIIQSNPMQKIEMLSTIKGTKKPFTLDEIKMIVDKIINYKNMIILLTCTGMRISEAIGVKDIDVKKGRKYFYIDLNKQFNTRSRQYTPCKWDSKRRIPIIPELIDCLTWGIPYPTLLDALNAALKKLNLEGKKFHSFRHFFISDCENKNINPLKVHYVAGHSLKGMQKIYTHLDEQEMDEIIAWQKDIYEFLTN